MKELLKRLSLRRDGFHIVSGILSETGFVLLLALGGFVICLLFSLF
jgi:hypothetical protein